MTDYYQAAVCRRGHVATGLVNSGEAVEARCSDCGAVVIVDCESCGHRIRGMVNSAGYTSLGYEPPTFCDSCGAPHPWADRQARIYELENLLDEEDIGEAERLLVREQLDALRDPGLSEDEQTERWMRVKKHAPGLLVAGQRIVESVMTTAIKAQIGP